MVVLFREGTYEILNCGIYLSLVIGVLLILRPVTNRLLTPGQRMFLWGVVWLAGFMPIWMELMGRIPLPISPGSFRRSGRRGPTALPCPGERLSPSPCPREGRRSWGAWC